MFKQLGSQEIETHVKIVGWLLIASHAVMLLIGAFVFFLLTGVGAVSGDGEAMAVLGVVATLAGGFLTLLSLPGILAGVGVLARQVWGRYLAIVVALLNLLNFPIGTALGAYAIWVLLQESANGYFTPVLTPKPA